MEPNAYSSFQNPPLAAILIPLSFFLLIFGVVYLSITAGNRKKGGVAELNNNLNKVIDNSITFKNSRTLLYGMLMSGIAFGFILGSFIRGYHEHLTLFNDPVMFISLGLLGVGLALVTHHLISGRRKAIQ